MTDLHVHKTVIRTVRRWSVYECPEHGLIDDFHVGEDRQCPVAVKGVGCERELTGPFVVEEVPHD